MKSIFLIPVAVLALLATGCRNTNKTHAEDGSGASDPARALELALPMVPDTLVTGEERASYVVGHFWDELDFSADERARDTAFMEQNFANFISVLPYTPVDEAQRAVGGLLDRAAADADAYSLLGWVTDRYLDDPNSPMRSEEVYVMFLRHIVDSACPDEARKVRAAYRLEQAMKNRPGTRGADFSMVTRTGKTTTLMQAVAADTTLVMFYDPDCEQCRQFTPVLAQSAVAQRFRVLAVDVATDRRLWSETLGKLPEAWEAAFALDPVQDDEIYVVPALPMLYLIAPDGTILLKDIPLAGV